MSNELIARVEEFVAVWKEVHDPTMTVITRRGQASLSRTLTADELGQLLALVKMKTTPAAVEADGSLDACFTAFGLAHRLYRENQALKEKLK